MKTCTKCIGSGSEWVVMDGLRVEVDCSHCHGSKVEPQSNACTKCIGSGSEWVVMDGLRVEVDCSHCHGSKVEPSQTE